MDQARILIFFWKKNDIIIMRPTDSSWVAAGPGLQAIRGVLLSFFSIQSGFF